MQTTIDGAGRIVVPKALREAMGLTPGRRIDIALSDGKIEIDLAPAAVDVAVEDGLPVAQPQEDLPPLTGEQVRATVEGTRR